MKRYFPFRHKAIISKAAAYEFTPLNNKPNLCGGLRTIIPFPLLPREKTKNTLSAIPIFISGNCELI